MMTRHVWIRTALATLTFGISAYAQQASVGGDAALGTGASGNVDAEAAPAPAPVAAPAMAAPAPVAVTPAVETLSDHDAMVGRLAFGYLGYTRLPFGAIGNVDANFPANYAVAPIIGIRYWLGQRMGIDAGLGVTTTFGSQKQESGGQSVSTNATAPTGLAIHFGVPLALSSAKHFSFQIIPEMNLGYAQQALTVAGVENELSGIHFDMGARIGGELHFGFIGVPELSLVGAVGLRLDMNQTKTETKGATPVTFSDGRTEIATHVNGNPWDIFTSSISAFYYL
jgi:hypothetical protein